MFHTPRLIFFLLLLNLSSPFFGSAHQTDTANKLTYAEAENKIQVLGDSCWKLRISDSDSAAALGERALALAFEYNILEPIPRLSNYLGVVYIHFMHKISKAIPNFHKALEYGMLLNDSLQIAYAYNNLGDAYLLNGNVPLSKYYSEKSLRLFELLNNPAGIAYGYVNLGLIARIDKDFSAAIDYFNKSKKIREARDDKQGIASDIYEIGKTYLMQDKLDTALLCFQDSYQRHLDILNIVYTAHCLNGIASIHYKRKELDKAYTLFHQSIELNKTRDNYYGLIDNYTGLALVCAEQNKKAEGEAALLEALSLSKWLHVPAQTLLIHKTYGQFYNLLGDYKQAANSLINFIDLYDSILANQQIETLEELQENFAIRQNLNQAQNELESNRTEFFYLLTIIALLIPLFILGVLRLRNKNKLNIKLQEINFDKDKMFSVISHDLKTPFNALLGFSNLLIEELKENNYENALKYADIINRKSKDSLNLLSDLLTWSRSQTGRITFNPVLMSMDSLFEELSYFFEIDSEKNSIQLIFSNTIKRKVVADIDILRIVCVNLITNSLKYTDKGGHIQISASETNAHILLKVSDTGIGIAPEMLKNLFQNQQQVQSIEGLRKEKGTGLGHLIVADLVQLHRGQIKASSELGKGSVFEIMIPKQ